MFVCHFFVHIFDRVFKSLTIVEKWEGGESKITLNLLT